MRPIVRALKLSLTLALVCTSIHLLRTTQYMDTMVRGPAYNNACLGVTNQHTPDPFFTYARGKFYLTFTANDRIPLWEAGNLIDFWDERNFKKGPVWTPAPSTPEASARLWAPELHALKGRWYIYFAAMDPTLGNRSHRMYVLGGPEESEDPHVGPWEFLGPIRGMDQRQWAIDGTVFELDDGDLYFAYSGWPLDRPWDDYDEKTQLLFILKLVDPVTAGSAPVVLSRPDQVWERTGPVGINEGPQWLASPHDKNHWRGLVYSCGASWTADYKMATLKYSGGDPLDPDSWFKSRRPLLQNAEHGNGPFGPGHGCFMHIGNETVALFHATDRDTDGNMNRKCRMQRVQWTTEGPWMGEVVGPFTRDLSMFLGGSQTGSLDRVLGNIEEPIHA